MLRLSNKTLKFQKLAALIHTHQIRIRTQHLIPLLTPRCISQKKMAYKKGFGRAKRQLLLLKTQLEWWQHNISTIYWLSLKVMLQCNWMKLLQMQSMFLTQQQANSNTTSINNGCYIYNRFFNGTKWGKMRKSRTK